MQLVILETNLDGEYLQQCIDDCLSRHEAPLVLSTFFRLTGDRVDSMTMRAFNSLRNETAKVAVAAVFYTEDEMSPTQLKNERFYESQGIPIEKRSLSEPIFENDVDSLEDTDYF